ncbi:MAG: FUSC family protein [Dongiaceae bacterium]
MRLPDPVRLRLGLRMVAAGVAAYGASLLIGAPQGFWAVVSALLIMQGSVGGTLKAGVDRVIGTVIGAAVGAGGVMLHGAVPELPVVVLLGLALLPTGLAAAISPTFRAAPISAAIVMLSAGGTGWPLDTASLRVVEIGVGSLVGMAAALFVLPSRAEHLLLDRVADALEAMGALIEGYLVTRPGDQALEEMRRHMRKAIAAAEIAAAETRPERVLRRGDHPEVEPLIRTLYRLRNGVAFIGRAAGRAAPEVEETAGRALAAFVADCAAALRVGRPAPAGRALAAAAAAVEMAKPDSPLAFGVGAIRHDLDDLVERIGEQAGHLPPAQ